MAGAFVLSAALAITIAGVDRPTAEALVAGAICPCSNAMRGNVDVVRTATVR